MSRPAALAAPLDFEVVGAAAGCAVVAGGLSLVLPFLVALTGALAAIAVAGFAAVVRAAGASARELRRPGPVLALAALGGGGALFLGAPPPLHAARGVLLGVALVPLAFAARSVPRPIGGSAR
jgi:hypothetical protein